MGHEPSLRHAARIVTPSDPDYPPGLRDLTSPPNLYVLGEIPSRGIAVVGSRTPPHAAERFAFELASRIEEPVVSGLALGIDTAAHRGALAANTPTIAYVPYGFGRTYPPENTSLEADIVRAGGAVATEYEPFTRPTRQAFVMRDRLQAAHAWAVILVASESTGGAMHTLRFAKRLGRKIFACTGGGNHGDSRWAGNVTALADGAVALPLDADTALRIVDAERRSATP
jgi:DNA processing protein